MSLRKALFECSIAEEAIEGKFSYNTMVCLQSWIYRGTMAWLTAVSQSKNQSRKLSHLPSGACDTIYYNKNSKKSRGCQSCQRAVHCLLLGRTGRTNPNCARSNNPNYQVSLISTIRLDLTFNQTGWLSLGFHELSAALLARHIQNGWPGATNVPSIGFAPECS